jgi:hypothetical protein
MLGQPVSVADAPLKHRGTGFAPRLAYDVFSSSIAIAAFSDSSAELRIESNLVLEIYAAERPPFEISAEALSYPFIYLADDRIDLSRMREGMYRDSNDRLGSWARGLFTCHYQGVSHAQWPNDNTECAPTQTGSVIWYPIKAVDIECRPPRAKELSKRASTLMICSSVNLLLRMFVSLRERTLPKNGGM